MGDRGNIAILHETGDQIWIYCHWGGADLWEALKDGIEAGEPRWEDESYFTKIIIGYVIPAESMREETGYGISGRMQDNEHPILVVDIPKQSVRIVMEDELIGGRIPEDVEPAHGSWSFPDYLKLTSDPREG
jgi:hypothetical protein